MRLLCQSCLSDDKSPCEPLPEAIVDHLGEKIDPGRFRKNEVLFKPGEPNRNVYLIRSGLVKITKQDSQDREHIISVCGRGNIVGMANLFTDWPQTTATSLVTCEVCRLDREDIMSVVRESPEMMLWMLSASAAETERNMERVVSLALPRAKERAAALILTLADLTGRQEKGTGRRAVNVVLHLSRQEMAQMIGVSRQHFSMILNELESDHVIELQGRRLEILDLDALEKMSGQSTAARMPEGESVLMALYNRRVPDKARAALSSMADEISPSWSRDARHPQVEILSKEADKVPDDPEIALVNVSGVLDRSTGLNLCKQISAALEQGKKKIAVDLSGVEDFDSGGIGSLFAMAGQLKTVSGTAILCGLPPSVRKALEVTKALALLGEAETPDKAFDKLKSEE